MSRAIKPRRMWRSDMTGLLYYKALHLRAKVSPVLVIDLSPESVEALQVALYRAFKLTDECSQSRASYVELVEAAKRAIGIKARGRK